MMQRKAISLILAALLIVSVAVPAYARDVTAFGFDNNRKRVASSEGYIFKESKDIVIDKMNQYWAWWADGENGWLVGKSYSQSLILSPDKFAGTGLNVQTPVVIIFAANRLYAVQTPIVDPTEENTGKKLLADKPLWGPVNIPGGDFSNEPAASHPTYYEDSKGNKRIYVGTSDGRLVVVNLKGDIEKICKLNTTSTNRRITSAPLVTEYMGQVVVVAGGGNDGKVYIVTNLDRKEGQSVHSWDVGGVVTSSPAPLYDNAGKIIGFAIASDGASGIVKMYEFSKILKTDSNGWLVKAPNGESIWGPNKGMAGIPASFAVDGKNIYFSDKRGRFYRLTYQYDPQKGICNASLTSYIGYYNAKTFINHSPAVDSKYVYFPIVDFQGTGKGKVVALDKNAMTKAKETPLFGSRIVTAPVVLEDANILLVGVESGHMSVNQINCSENPAIMLKIGAQPFSTPEGIKSRNNSQALADGLCTEISVGDGWLVCGGTLPPDIYPERGGVFMIKLNATLPDFIIDKVDPGTAQAEPGKTYKGIIYASRAAAIEGKDETSWVSGNVPVKVTSEAKINTVNGGQGTEAIIKLDTPGTSLQIPFEWTAPSKEGEIKITADINPADEQNGRMYTERHLTNNSAYATVMVKSQGKHEQNTSKTGNTGEIDLSIDSGEYNPALMVGETDNYSVVVKNTSSNAITTDLVWKKDGTQIRKVSITIPAKGTKEDCMKFTMPDKAKWSTVKLVVEVNPNRNKPSNEKDWSNNRVDMPVQSLGPDTRSQSEGSNPYLTK